MADDREKISNGPNDRPLNETIAGTGPGIPDEALSPGEEIPDGRPRMKKRGYVSGSAHPRKRPTPFRSMASNRGSGYWNGQKVRKAYRNRGQQIL